MRIREAKPGEAGLVVNFYYHLFADQFNFRPLTEQYFLHAMEDYFNDPKGNILYVAEENGQICGSVCIAKTDEHAAQLRMFGVGPALQGQGAGNQLMTKAMDFCKEKEYQHVILWTVDICKAARHLYAKFGFQKTDEKPNDSWADYQMTEELWKYNS